MYPWLGVTDKVTVDLMSPKLDYVFSVARDFRTAGSNCFWFPSHNFYPFSQNNQSETYFILILH